MINVDQLLNEQVPKLKKHPKVKKNVVKVVRKLLHEEDINGFIMANQHLGSHEFLDRVMHLLGLSYTVDNWQLENIPAEGRVVIVANHPFGSLDGIALLKMVSQVRPDIKIVTNEILNHLDPLAPYFLPVNNMKGSTKRSQYTAIESALQAEQAVIFFPAGEVSRVRLSGIKDSHWHTGFLNMAMKTQSPILPIHVGGSNSNFFYSLSLLSKSMSMLLLVKEMFRKTGISIPFSIGEIIPFSVIGNVPDNKKVAAQLFRKHLYSIVNGKKQVFETEKPIAHPQPRRKLKSEIEACELLTQTSDGKEVRLLLDAKDTCLLSEIGRLRELSFRAVGEGTRERVDIDEFDNHYHHIILWDPEELELVGAYRVKQTTHCEHKKLYTSTLFNFEQDFTKLTESGLELGRSFVQPRYWGKRSLDYLWYGIGAYLTKFPHLRYLFGPVSISNDYNRDLMDWLAFYYSYYYPAKGRYASPRNAFHIGKRNREKLQEAFRKLDKVSAFKHLKQQLKMHNMTVPTMFKQYSELCEQGGVSFSSFNIDSAFNDCVDGLVVVDVHQLLEKKRSKYLPDWQSSGS